MAEVIIEEQHPIPQQISAFQFHLVGDMTLKQFLQVAGGALVALAIYASGLPGLIKWPLILISFGIGAALAFLPFEDRPLAKWVFSFFKSIYSPTVFVWQKMAKVPEFFQAETAAPPKPPGVPPTPVKHEVVFLSKVQPAPEETRLEKQEESFFERLAHLTRPPEIYPVPTVTTGVAPVLPPKQVPPKPKRVMKVKKEVIVPEKGAVAIPHKEKVEPQVEKKPPVKISTTTVAQVVTKKGKIAGKQARFSSDAAPPVPPTKANVIVGQTVDPDGKIVEGAILEIKDKEGRPVRALKTNKLGHFMIVTSLLNGKFEITTEKEGLVFEPVTFTATGSIIPPLAIWAKERSKNQESGSLN